MHKRNAYAMKFQRLFKPIWFRQNQQMVLESFDDKC